MAEFVSYMDIVPELIGQLGANFSIFIGPIALIILLVAIYFFFLHRKKQEKLKITPAVFKKSVSRLDKIAKKTKDD